MHFVIIILELGARFSHHWDAPLFKDDNTLFMQDLDIIRDDDLNNQPKMLGAFLLAKESRIPNINSNVQIFILITKNLDTGREIFQARVKIIVNTLTRHDKLY